VQWRDRFLARARQNPRLLNLDSNYRETKPEVRVEIDRRKAAELGVSIQAVGRTIETMLGSREVGTYVQAGEDTRSCSRRGRSTAPRPTTCRTSSSAPAPAGSSA
jgi:multidrug efflux pump